MGCSNSKSDKDEALLLCKQRRRFIHQAIDSRYALAAAQASYIQSLRSIGIALRRFAEAEALAESSLSATELDKPPSPPSSSSPSQSSVPIPEARVSNSPLPRGSPNSLPVSTMCYMKSSGNAAVTVRVNPPSTCFVDEESMDFTMLPPPPPFLVSGSSWDYFEPSEDSESFRFVGGNWRDEEQTKAVFEQGRSVDVDGGSSLSGGSRSDQLDPDNGLRTLENATIPPMEAVTTFIGRAAFEQAGSSNGGKGEAENKLSGEREDPSEFITHRAKDFLSSLNDIEHRFIRASESGKEVSRLLEVNQIRVGYYEAKGRSSSFTSMEGLRLACCGEKASLVSHEPSQNVSSVITQNQSRSSLSTPSKNHISAMPKDDLSESGSDFVEEFCMFAGSHSSSLDRLYAWERKLYDEVKASQRIRNEYDRKCFQLRQQFAKDAKAQVMDRTRSVVKDLHSQIRVAIHAVNSISRRIEKMRDEELLPQLIELVLGLIKMWKDMLECHHAQYITISLAYHTGRASSWATPPGDTHRTVLVKLRQEIELLGSSFADWMNSHTSYMDALNRWLHNCVLPPQGRSRRRNASSPRRAPLIAPPIFALCSDWLGGLRALPSNELIEAIDGFVCDLNRAIAHLMEEQKQCSESTNGGSDCRDEGDDGNSLHETCIRTGLTRVLDRLTKFSEAAVRAFEDVRQKCEAAQRAYANCRPVILQDI